MGADGEGAAPPLLAATACPMPPELGGGKV